MIFLADENFPFTSIKILRNSGYEVISVREIMPGVKDINILKKAQDERLIILTFDRDFGELVFKDKMAIPGGLVYFRIKHIKPDEPAVIILDLINTKEFLIEDNFTVIQRLRIRQRKMI